MEYHTTRRSCNLHCPAWDICSISARGTRQIRARGRSRRCRGTSSAPHLHPHSGRRRLRLRCRCRRRRGGSDGVAKRRRRLGSLCSDMVGAVGWGAEGEAPRSRVVYKGDWSGARQYQYCLNLFHVGGPETRLHYEFPRARAELFLPYPSVTDLMIASEKSFSSINSFIAYERNCVAPTSTLERGERGSQDGRG